MAVTMRRSLGLFVLLLCQSTFAAYDIGQFSQQIAQQTVRVAADDRTWPHARGCAAQMRDVRASCQLTSIANALLAVGDDGAVLHI